MRSPRSANGLRRLLDLRRLLEHPAMYRLRGTALSPRVHTIFVQDYLDVRPGDRVLDIGCGPGEIVEYLPHGIEYVGFDVSEPYVRAARARFGHRATFICQRVDQQAVEERGRGSFDLVLAHGVLHHLDDAEADAVFALARAALKPRGRLVTADGCFVAGQARIARYLLARDRGAHVRTETGYRRLAERHFPSVTSAVRHDVTRVPYTMIYLTCRA